VTLLAFVVGSALAVAPRADLVVAHGTVVTMDARRQILVDGAVAVASGRIIGVGPSSEISREFSPREVLDASGTLVIPGLVNAHTHAPMVLFRGMADDLSLADWLERFIFPAEAKNVDPEFVRVGTRLAVLEMMRSGTTTFADMYYYEDEIAEVVHGAGLRGVLTGQGRIRES
jgi:5-methylthioadenosine/S-adenosylhomocysteine deaminase